MPKWLDKMALRRNLLAWFAENRRALPWRTRDSLYGIWVAEIMLQQTTVEAVTPYYRRFLARFPAVGDLAAADLEEVLAAWSGLGYYRRARMLHAAAGRIVARGGFPETAAGWRELPGVGEYAAGAIASLGLGERTPAVDANARRVLLRWLCSDATEAGTIKPARLRAAALDIMPADGPGDWNEAVMELGALVCRARAPLCDRCPVRSWCRAARSGRPETIPPLPARRSPLPVALAQLVLVVANRVLVLPPGHSPVVAGDPAARVVREDFSSLWRGMHGLPGTPWLAAKSPALRLEPTLWRPWLTELGLAAGNGPSRAGICKHVITHHRLTIHVHRLEVPGLRAEELVPVPGAILWRPEVEGVALSRLTEKVLKTAGMPGV